MESPKIVMDKYCRVLKELIPNVSAADMVMSTLGEQGISNLK